MFIKNNLSWINIEIACDCLNLNRSSYYEWFKNEESRAIRMSIKNALVQSIKLEHTKARKRYGATKIAIKLKKSGIKCCKNTVAKLMKQNDICSIATKKFKATTNSAHNNAVFDNILNRQFIVDKPNHAWVSDITYIPTNEGWLYLATVIDLYSNKIIGYATSEHINKQLVIDALTKALRSRDYPAGVIVHSDRGSQYASNAYKELLTTHKLVGSMSRKGNCWDNAVAENFFGLIKKEYINHVVFVTRDMAKLGVFDYIEGWYNTQRIHSKLNYLTPNEFEVLNNPESVCGTQKTIKLARNLKMEVKSAQLSNIF
jgi:putative transposase